MRHLTLHCGLLLALSACSGGASSPEPTAGGARVTTSGGTTGTRGTSGTSSGITSNFASATGTSGGSTSGGSVAGGQAELSTVLHGPLAFDPGFAGEFYGSLPDGGPDLSNLDCRISDGTDQGQLCSLPEPLDSDGGATTSSQIVDIYVTSVSGTSLSTGVAQVTEAYATADDVFATIDLTYLYSDGGWDFERAVSGEVTYQIDALGMSGRFQAVFPGYEDGGGGLSGRFSAGYCGSLSAY